MQGYGCPVRIRTSIDGVRVRSLTIRRRGISLDQRQIDTSVPYSQRGGRVLGTRLRRVNTKLACPPLCSLLVLRTGSDAVFALVI